MRFLAAFAVALILLQPFVVEQERMTVESVRDGDFFAQVVKGFSV